MINTRRDLMREPGRTRPGYVLLVEDDAVSQAIAVLMLATLGFDVDVASDGAEALAAATRIPHDAILLDLQIPVLDGYLVATEIRRRQAGGPRTPIIAVTASPLKSCRERCVAADMDDYLAKPFSLKAMATIFLRWAPNRSLPATGLNRATPLTSAQASAFGVAGGEPTVLDPEIVGRLIQLGADTNQDLLGQLSEMFLADADAQVLALRHALAQADSEAVTRSAHQLSGASANLGAAELARLCAHLSTASATGELNGGQIRLTTVEAELDRVRLALCSLTRSP